MKKLTLLVLALAFTTITQAQFNQDAPWMRDLNIELRKNTNNPVTFQEIVDAFNAYWETHDPNIKGSGYKPFKRWENYWKNFVKEDGTLPTSAELWNTWQQVRAQKNASRMVDESDWQPIGPFDHINTGSWSSGQGRVNAIHVDPSTYAQANKTFYSGAPAGGIWKSVDSGNTWEPLSDYLPQIGVSGIAVDYNDPDVIYIATGDDDAGDSYSVGVMKSINGGQTWLQTGLNPNNSPSSMNDIYIHPTNSNILWVATNNGVYKTTNGGTSWSNSNGTQGFNVKDIKIKPNDPMVIYAVTNSRFYKSTDGGDSFNLIASGVPTSSSRLVIDVTPDNPNVVYILSALNGGFQGVYKSTNAGNSFTTVATITTVGDLFDGSPQSYYDMAFAVSDTNENDVYVGVLNIWKGTVVNNNSSTFTQLNTWNSPNSPAYTHADIHLLRFYDGELFTGTDGGFYKSSDGGSNFTDLTAGMQISQFYKVAVSKQSSQKIVGGLQDNGGHAFNNNQWQNYYGADGMDTAIDPNNSDQYYGFTQFGGTLNISNSAGGTLSSQVSAPAAEVNAANNDSGGNWITPLVMNNESELYSAYRSLYRLENGAWTLVTASPFNSDIDHLEIDDINPDNVYVGLNRSLRKSTNRGITFSTVYNFGSNITSIEVNTNDSNIVYVTTAGDVFRSIDGGNSFSNISGTLPGVTKNVVKHQNLHPDNPLFLGTSLGVYRYDDNTGDWELFNNDLPNVSVTDLEINIYDNTITAATYGRGIWQSSIPTQLAQNDVVLLDVEGLSSTVSCDSDLSLQLHVRNNGVNAINAIDVTYNVDGTPNNFTWTGNLASDQTTLIDIPVLTLGFGLHQFSAETTIANDAYSVNNLSQNYNLYVNGFYDTQVIEPNDFEIPDDDLLVYDEGADTQYWERGRPMGTELNSAYSARSAYGTNLNGEYESNTKSYLVTKCYDLNTISAPVLKFHMVYDLEENWDIVYVEYSTDSGQSWKRFRYSQRSKLV